MDRRAFLQKGIVAGVAASAQPGLVQAASADPALAAHSDLTKQSESNSIVIENAEFRFVIGAGGIARSLTHKRSGQECLDPTAAAPVFWMKQYEPLPGQFKLAYRMEAKVFPARSVRREGDRLIISFAVLPHEATIKLKVTDSYVAFQVEKVGYREQGFRKIDLADKTPIDEMVFLQIPVRNRKNFGKWLNVMWDDELAVNVLAADPWARITDEPRKGYHLLQAGTVNSIRTEGVTAALIVTGTGSQRSRRILTCRAVSRAAVVRNANIPTTRSCRARLKISTATLPLQSRAASARCRFITAPLPKQPATFPGGRNILAAWWTCGTSWGKSVRLE